MQFAKAHGATVIATVSSPEKAAHARAAGADHTIDYRGEDVAERVKALTGGRGVNRVIEMDLTANARLLPGVLRPRGTVVIYGTRPEATLPAGWCLQNQITLKFFLIYELDWPAREKDIAAFNTMLAAGRLRNAVAARYPLADIAAAPEAVESGKVMGNVVVTLG